jgi:TatD DNase family protein
LIKYIDIHTHTFHPLPDVLQLVNCFPEDLDQPGMPPFISAGLHPWHIREETWESVVARVNEAAGQINLLAIGETGLDKKVAIPYNIQQQVFEHHLEIAGRVKKPVIIHCVRSYSEMLAYRKTAGPALPWIFHWFNADSQIAFELVRKNCYLSFGHMLFREESRAYRVFNEIPADRLFLETDDAGFAIEEIYKRAAAIRNLPVDQLQNQIQENFFRCFNNIEYGRLVKPD